MDELLPHPPRSRALCRSSSPGCQLGLRQCGCSLGAEALHVRLRQAADLDACPGEVAPPRSGTYLGLKARQHILRNP